MCCPWLINSSLKFLFFKKVRQLFSLVFERKSFRMFVLWILGQFLLKQRNNSENLNSSAFLPKPHSKSSHFQMWYSLFDIHFTFDRRPVCVLPVCRFPVIDCLPSSCQFWSSLSAFVGGYLVRWCVRDQIIVKCKSFNWKFDFLIKMSPQSVDPNQEFQSKHFASYIPLVIKVWPQVFVNESHFFLNSKKSFSAFANLFCSFTHKAAAASFNQNGSKKSIHFGKYLFFFVSCAAGVELFLFKRLPR